MRGARYRRIMRHRGHKIAVVAVARTLLEIAYHLLARETTSQESQITQWKTQLLERATDFFATPADRQAATPDVKALHAKIGQLVLENDFLAGALGRLPDASGKR